MSEEGDIKSDGDTQGVNAAKGGINDPASIIPDNMRQAIMDMINMEVQKGVDVEMKIQMDKINVEMTRLKGLLEALQKPKSGLAPRPSGI